MVVYTEAVQFKVDSKLVDFIEKKLSKMDQFFDRIINARVVLKLENTWQVREKIAEVRINVPGETVFVKVTHKSFEAAVEQAVDSLKRQIIKYKEKQS